jgi:hypothetical protein
LWLSPYLLGFDAFCPLVRLETSCGSYGELFGKYSSLGEEAQLFYGYRLAPTQARVLELVEARPAFSLLYLKTHPP